MGRFNCLGLVVVIGKPFRAAAAHLLEETANAPAHRQARLAMSASPIADGVLLRLAGENGEEVARRIRQSLSFLSDSLHHDPWCRKF
jgi:hypothetical protein